jgi:hypothetical protein
MIKALAYCADFKVTAVKSFITLIPDGKNGSIFKDIAKRIPGQDYNYSSFHQNIALNRAFPTGGFM